MARYQGMGRREQGDLDHWEIWQGLTLADLFSKLPNTNYDGLGGPLNGMRDQHPEQGLGRGAPFNWFRISSEWTEKAIRWFRLNWGGRKRLTKTY